MLLVDAPVYEPAHQAHADCSTVLGSLTHEPCLLNSHDCGIEEVLLYMSHYRTNITSAVTCQHEVVIRVVQSLKHHAAAMIPLEWRSISPERAQSMQLLSQPHSIWQVVAIQAFHRRLHLRMPPRTYASDTLTNLSLRLVEP